jgi:uncharacterized membrane protein
MKKYTIERTSLLYKLLNKVLKDYAMPSNTCELRNMLIWWTLLFPFTIVGYLVMLLFGDKASTRWTIFTYGFVGFLLIALLIIFVYVLVIATWLQIVAVIAAIIGCVLFLILKSWIEDTYYNYEYKRRHRIETPSTFRKVYQDLKDKVCTPIEYK